MIGVGLRALVLAVILARPAEPSQPECNGRLGGIALGQTATFEAVLECRVSIAGRCHRHSEESQRSEKHGQPRPREKRHGEGDVVGL